MGGKLGVEPQVTPCVAGAETPGERLGQVSTLEPVLGFAVGWSLASSDRYRPQPPDKVLGLTLPGRLPCLKR